MRLWSKQLITVLPREQLVSQWRECSAIAGAIQKNGTPNHLLVNYVLDYPFDHFISYSYYIREEMSKRGYHTSNKVWEKIITLKPNFQLVPLNELFSTIMDSKYLLICYYNLGEKYLRGGLSIEDMKKIENIIKEPKISIL